MGELEKECLNCIRDCSSASSYILDTSVSVCSDHDHDSLHYSITPLSVQIDWVLVSHRSLDDSGYGGSTVDLLPKVPPPPPPPFLVNLDRDLLQEALTTLFSLAFPVDGVPDLTGEVTTTFPHALAHGGFSDIYCGEWSKTTRGNVETRPVRDRLMYFLFNNIIFNVRSRSNSYVCYQDKTPIVPV